MVFIPIFIIALIVSGIYYVFKKEADKRESKVNWVTVILASLPFAIVFGFIAFVGVYGMSS